MKNWNIYVIQNRLLELEKETRGISGNFNDLLIEKAQLEKERQFILDERNGLKSRIIWSILIPIIVSLVINFLIKLK